MQPYFRDEKTSNGPTELSVMTLSGAFALLLVGLSLAFATFLIEFLFAAFISNKNRLNVIFKVVY